MAPSPRRGSPCAGVSDLVSIPKPTQRLPLLTLRKRDDVITAALAVVSTRSKAAIGELFEVVRRLDRARRDAACPTCARRRLGSSSTLRVLSSEDSQLDDVRRALQRVHRLRQRDVAAELVEPWLWARDEATCLQAVRTMGRYVDLQRARLALHWPAWFGKTHEIRLAATRILEDAGDNQAVATALVYHPGLRRYLRNHRPEDALTPAEQAARERRALLKSTGGWCEEFRRLNGG